MDSDESTAMVEPSHVLRNRLIEVIRCSGDTPQAVETLRRGNLAQRLAEHLEQPGPYEPNNRNKPPRALQEER